MADLKISALNSLAGADLVAADVVAVVDDSASETKKLTVSDLIANGSTLISDNTIPSAKILFSAGAIDTAELAASSVETAKINDSAVTAAKLADNSSVTLVSTLPASGDFTGQIALDTDDDKIYIWDGSAWDSVKGAGSINVVNGSTTGEINIVTSTSGDTVTVSATLDNTTAAAQFLAGPTGAGGTVGYRAIIGTDLPTATTTAKGGVIVNGNGLTMSSDTIAIDNTVTAETEENHIVQYDANGLVTGGRAIVAADVPNATSTAAGIIKPGSGLGVTGAGELNHNNSVTAGTASKVTFDAQGHITGTESLVAADIPDLDADKITTGSVPTARIAADAVTAEKLADRSTATIAETTPAGGAFIGQTHLNSITGDYFLWDGNVWQPIGISVGEIILAGTYDASTNLMATVTAEGTALSFVVGSALPAASSSNKGYYVVVSEAGTGTSPAPTVALNPPDFLLSTGTAYTEIDVSSTVTAQQASNVAFTAAGNIAATNVQAAIEELDTEKVAAASPSLTGTVSIGTGGTIQFEGATANDFESTLTVVDPTADRTLSLPDVTGTLVSTGDTGSVTSTMITDGTIVNADINASAEIAVSKLANGTARQLLQTDVAGSGVEFTSNVDVPGTLDVTGTATLDSALHVTGDTAMGHTSPSHKLDVRVNNTAAARIGGTTFAMEIGQLGSSSSPGFNAVGGSASMLFRIGGTEAMRIDPNRRVGIGVASPQTGLHVSDGSSLAAPQNTGAGRLTVQNSSSADIQLMSANTGYNHIFFGDEDDANVGVINYVHNSGTNAMTFATNAAERVRIDSSGNVGIGTSAASALLHLSSNDPAIFIQDANGTGNSINSTIQFRDSSDAQQAYFGYASSSDSHFSLFNKLSGGDLVFGTASTERLRIDSSGNLDLGNNDGSASNQGFYLQPDGAGYIFTSSALDAINIYQSGTKNVEINSSGSAYFASNFGIGTPSPASILHINPSGDCYVTLQPGSTDGNAGINIRNSAGTQIGYVMYDTDDNYLRFGTNNTERMRIDSSGRVGIGNTTMSSFTGNSSDNLVVGGGSGSEGITVYSAAQGSLTFADGTSGDAAYRGAVEYNHTNDNLAFRTAGTGNRMVIDSSGRLLLGTASAFDGGSDTLLQVLSTGGARFALARNDTTTAANDSIGRIRWYGNDSDGNYDECARIEVIADADHASNSKPSALTFHTTAASAESSSERMRILSDGTIATGGLTATPGTVAAGSYIQHAANAGFFGNNGDAKFGSSANNPVLFQVNGSEKVRIDTSGNVGIGTSSATQKLDVRGNVYVGDKIGINTTSPDQFLDIESSSTTTARVTAHGYICRNNWGSVSSLGNGMVSPASNTLAFATNSTERLRIDANGTAKFTGANAPSGLDTRITQYGSLLVATDSDTVSAARCSIDAGNGNINSTGSATFGGPVTLGSSGSRATNGYTALIDNNQASTAACFSANNSNADGINFLGLGPGNTITSKINNDGSATLNGNVGIGKTSASSTTGGILFVPSGTSEIIAAGNNITPLIIGSADDVTLTLVDFTAGSATPGGSISITSGTSVSYNTSSDYRLKENVVDLDGAITRVKQLSPKRFNFIVDADTTVDGFLAHEAQTVVPEAVTGTHNEVDDDGNAVMQGIDQSKLVPLLTAALQEAIAKIETLEAKVAALEAE